MLPPHSCRIKHQRAERPNGICVPANHWFKQFFDYKHETEWQNQRVLCHQVRQV